MADNDECARIIESVTTENGCFDISTSSSNYCLHPKHNVGHLLIWWKAQEKQIVAFSPIKLMTLLLRWKLLDMTFASEQFSGYDLCTLANLTSKRIRSSRWEDRWRSLPCLSVSWKLPFSLINSLLPVVSQKKMRMISSVRCFGSRWPIKPSTSEDKVRKQWNQPQCFREEKRFLL